MPCQEQLAAEDAAFISIQAFPALLDLPEELEVSAVSCGSRHTAVVTRECPVGQGQPLGGQGHWEMPGLTRTWWAVSPE